MVFYWQAGKPICFVLAIILMLCITGCGSSDSDHQVFSDTESISGKVADGYVSGATLTVYSSDNLTEENVIGTGTTDANGAFSIALSTTTVPDPIYIKSEGGTDIDLGLPAPVMLFAGSADGNGSYNITPLTDMVYKYIGVQGSLDASQTFLTGVLGISTSDLGADPVENASAGAALAKVLASGTQGSTLSAGEYTMHILYFEQDDLDATTLADLNAVAARIVELPITVNTDGSIENEVSVDDGIDFDHDSVSDLLEAAGGVVGSSVFISIDVNEFDDGDSGWQFSIAGELGLFGGLSGRCYLREEGSLKQGVFVATFTPVDVTETQETAMFQQLGVIMASDQASYLLFNDVLIGEAAVPQISYGTIVLAQDGTSGFNYSALSVNRIIYDGPGVGDDPVWADESGDLDYLDAAEQTRILASRQDNTYFIIPAGCRKGICVVVDGGDGIVKAGQMFLNRSDGLAPVLEPDATYNLAQVCIGSFVLANEVTRADALEMVEVSDGITELAVPSTDDMALGSGYNADSGEILGVSGSFLALKKDADNDFADVRGAGDDYLMALEMYETGALIGTRLDAGSVFIEGYGLYNNYENPINYVMFAYTEDTPAPSCNATMKFLAREFQGGGVFSEIPVWTSGYLTLNIDQASSTGDGVLLVENIDGCGYSSDDPIEDEAFGEAVRNYPSTVTMNVERIGPSNSGLLHIYGTGTYTIYYLLDTEEKDYYWDIYWPIGAPRATYMFSYYDDDAAAFRVNEIGEAYITY